MLSAKVEPLASSPTGLAESFKPKVRQAPGMPARKEATHRNRSRLTLRRS